MVHLHDTLGMPPANMRLSAIQASRGGGEGRGSRRRRREGAARVGPEPPSSPTRLLYRSAPPPPLLCCRPAVPRQDTLGGVMATANLKINVHEHYLSFALCDVCVNAYTR